jgi:hypothetical protein
MLSVNKISDLLKGWENGKNRGKTIKHPFKLNKKVNVMGYIMLHKLNKGDFK